MLWIGITLYVVFALGIFFFLIFRHRRKARAILHYEEIRDELTLREQEEVEEQIEGEHETGFSLGNLLGGVIVILVGLNIFPVIEQELERSIVNDSYISETVAPMMDLVSVFFYIGIVGAGIALAVGGLRKAGLV